jgi:hypothetical protein
MISFVQTLWANINSSRDMTVKQFMSTHAQNVCVSDVLRTASFCRSAVHTTEGCLSFILKLQYGLYSFSAFKCTIRYIFAHKGHAVLIDSNVQTFV